MRMSKPEPTVRVSQDGETWYEISRTQFRKFMDDETCDMWVDLSDDEMFLQVTMASLRDMEAAAEAKAPTDWDRPPKELYGIPVVFEDKP